MAGQPVSTPTPEPTSTAETRTVNEQVPPRKGTKTPPRYDNLDYSLNELASQYESEDSPTRGIRTPQAGDVEESPAVVVYVDPAGLREVFRFLQTNGARVREPDDGDEYLVANVPVSMLPRLSRQRGVEYVKVDELIRATGGPGATAHGVPPWDTAGYDGTGVKIGVLDLGFQGYSSLIGTGLPQPEAVRCWITDVNVQHNTLAECETVSGMENHGTAVTEMLYDVAPGATYYLARVGRTADIVEAVEWLNDHEVDVMNFSGATPWDVPGDGTSPYAHSPLNAVDKAVMNGAFFSATAGNEGGDSWYGKLHDADGDNVLEFSSGDECNSVTLEEGQNYDFRLRWEDVSWTQAATDLDLYLMGSDGMTVFRASVGTQNGRNNSIPLERIKFPATSAGPYCLVVGIASGHSIPSWAQLVMVVSGGAATIEHTTEGYSIGNPGETTNDGALTAGAAAHNQTSTIYEFSSRGPLPDGTIKPDIVGAHRVHSAAYDRPVSGTSFAAPHVAGLAALVKERFPDYTPAKIATYLKDNALERGDNPPNNTWGHGFAQLPANPPSQPVITGNAAVGQELKVDTSTITDGDGVTTATASNRFTVRWIRVGSDNAHEDITGQTSDTYTVTSADVAHKIKVRVRFTDDAGNDEFTTSEATGLVNTAATGKPVIDGTARIGLTLTAQTSSIADADGLEGATFAYQWVRLDRDGAGTDINNATAMTYTLADDDAGHKIKVEVTFTDDGAFDESLESDLTNTVGPYSLVSNTGQRANTFGFVAVLPATANVPTTVAQSFTTGAADGFLITGVRAFVGIGTPTVEIWNDNSGEPGTIHATLTNPGSIPNDVVTAGLSKFTADDVMLAATTTYWVLFKVESGQQIRVRTTTLTGEDEDSEENWLVGDDFQAVLHGETAWGASQSDQLETGPIMLKVFGLESAPNEASIGELRLSGTAEVGEDLTVDVSNIRDPNGIADATFGYQWVRIDGGTETDISGATSTSYTLEAEDEGKRIKVEMSYTDDGGYDEELVSVITQPVRPADDTGIMVTNLFQADNGETAAAATYPYLMQAFDTGSNADGYTISGVRVARISRDSGVDPVVSITEYGTFLGESAPGEVLYTMSTQTDISTDHDNPSVDVDYAADDFYLAPNTRYWVLFFYRFEGSGNFRVGQPESDDEDFGAAQGWTIEDFHTYVIANAQVNPLRYGHTAQLQLAILGKAGAGNRLSTGKPAITGSAQVGETLTTDTSGIMDGDGLTMVAYSYQWVRVDGDTGTLISGATDNTYTLADDDEGMQISVKVSFTDDRGHSAEIFSRATQLVRPATGGGIQVTNHGQEIEDLIGINEAYPLGAVSFTTGSHSGGYDLNAVRVLGIVGDDGATPKVFLYDDATGLPGTSLHDFTVPSDISIGQTALPLPADFTVDDAILAPNTTYWVVFERPSSTADFYVLYTDSTDADFGASPGWSLGDDLAYRESGSTIWDKGGFSHGLFLFQVAVVADPINPPGAPASLTAAGDTEAVLSWTAPTSDGGSAVLKYQYRFKTTGEYPDWSDVPDGPDAGTDQDDERSYTVTGLANGTEHTFQVRAVNSVGEGSPAEDTATPVTVPGAPASLSAAAGDTEAVLSWTAPASDGGSPVLKYQYRVSDDGKITWSPDWTDVPDSDSDSDLADERSYTVAGLSNGDQHTFEVRAVNAVGGGAEKEATATPAATPTLPLTLDQVAGDDVVNMAEKAAGFTVSGRTGTESGAAVTVVVGTETITTSSVSLGVWTVSVPADAPYITGTSVSVTVNATQSGYNDAAEVTRTLRVDLVKPALQAASVNGTALTLTYSEELDAASTPAGADYTVEVAGSSAGLASTDPVSIEDTAVKITLDSVVDPGETVTVDYTVPTGMDASPVRDTAGNPADALTGRTVANLPGAPASLTAAAGDTEAVLSWTAPTSDGGSAVLKYQYRFKTTGEYPDWSDVPDGPDAGTDQDDERSYTVTGLANGTEHTFQVRAVNSVGEGSPAEDTATPATTLPESVDWGELPAHRALAGSNGLPRAVWSDGETVWVTDLSWRIFAYDLATMSPVADKDVSTLASAGNHNANGIWSDGTTIWVSDDADDRIYAYVLDGGARRESLEIDNLESVGNGSLKGLWSDGTTIWVVDNQDDKIYAYTLSGGVLQADLEINTLSAAGNSRPAGLWSDGTTMWVVDDEDGKIYAYAVDGGARQQNLEFDSGTLRDAGNGSPKGLWSDGVTMWVIDNEDDRLYAYDMPEGYQPPQAGAGGSAANSPASGTPTISGAAQIGQTLSASTSGIIDSDGLTSVTYSYQWVRVASDNTESNVGADSTTYPLVPADAGHAIKVVVSFTDDANNPEMRESATTATITIPNNEPSFSAAAATREVAENTAPGQNVGVPVSATDADGDDLTYTLSGTDAGSFIIDSGTGQIKTSAALDYETKTTYSVVVSVRDSKGSGGSPDTSNDDSVDVTIDVTDVAESPEPTPTLPEPVDWGELPAHRKLADSNGLPRAVWSDGETVWVTDLSWRIFAYDLATMSPMADKDVSTLASAGNHNANGIWSDGTNIWVSDDADDHIYVYAMDGGARRESLEIDNLESVGNGSPKGLWSDGTTMWVVDNQDDKIYAYTLSGGVLQADLEINTLSAAGNSRPAGLWSDGTTMWVVDDEDGKIYAYAVDGGARQQNLEFDSGTLRGAGNASPKGLWSDGVIMWVVDNEDDRLYAYDMPEGY